jgi:type I restriction enzyme, S subunit
MTKEASRVEHKIIKLGEITRFRLDPEYYQNEFIALEQAISATEKERLENIAIIRSGTTPRDRDDLLEEGVNLLKTNDIRNLPLLTSRSYYKISDETARTMKATELQPRDVLMNIVGATLDVIGRVAYVPVDFATSNITQAMSLIRVTDARFLPEYLFVFLLSKFGNLQARRLARPTGQYNLNLPEVGSIEIPVLPKSIQYDIAKTLESISEKYRTADEKTSLATQLLSDELGFAHFSWSDGAISVRHSVEVISEGRFDSEFWQEGYDEILQRILNYKNGSSRIRDVFKQSAKPHKSVAGEEYAYVEISDIDVKSGNVTPNNVASFELPANAKQVLKERSLLASKVRPNRGAVGIVEDFEGVVVSGALLVLSEDKAINLETLMTYLRLAPIKELLLKFNTGTSYPTITDEVILDLLVPLVPKVIQSKIAKLIQESNSAHKNADQELQNLVSSLSTRLKIDF